MMYGIPVHHGAAARNRGGEMHLDRAYKATLRLLMTNLPKRQNTKECRDVSGSKD